MFFLQLPEVYINLKYILSINKNFREVQMINEDKYNLTKEEASRLVKLLETKQKRGTNMFVHGFFHFMVSFILGLVFLAIFGIVIMGVSVCPHILIPISIFLGAIVEVCKHMS